MKKVSIIIVLAVAVSACSSPSAYQKNNNSQADFQKDLWECKQLVNQSYNAPNSQGNAGAAIGHAIGRAMSEKGRINDCMYGRGYQIQ
jgi:hypothetical protein